MFSFVSFAFFVPTFTLASFFYPFVIPKRTRDGDDEAPPAEAGSWPAAGGIPGPKAQASSAEAPVGDAVAAAQAAGEAAVASAAALSAAAHDYWESNHPIPIPAGERAPPAAVVVVRHTAVSP